MLEKKYPKSLERMIKAVEQQAMENRVKMGFSLFDFAKRLITQSILEENPKISSAALRQELFLRIYGNDFDPVKRKKILSYLAGHP